MYIGICLRAVIAVVRNVVVVVVRGVEILCDKGAFYHQIESTEKITKFCILWRTLPNFDISLFSVHLPLPLLPFVSRE